MENMEEKITTGYGSGGTNRQILKNILPLDTPLAVDIFPIHACNFKCKFCVCSLDNDKQGFDFDTNVMSMNLFRKCIDEIKGFPKKIKMLRFVGVGEPLLHKDIVQMVKYAKGAEISEKMEIITNGSLLTKEISDGLIESGLSQIRISIEALDEDIYEEITGVKVDFSKLINNIRYLYENKKDMHINVKIINYAIKSAEDEQRFYEIFENICDTMAIECLVEASSKVDYSTMKDKIGNKTLRGHALDSISICPQPYYLMQICPDGKVFPCCSLENAPVMGNCSNEDIVDIWNGKIYNDFRLKMLDGASNMNNICASCSAYKYNMFPEDKIYPEDVPRLKKLYGER